MGHVRRRTNSVFTGGIMSEKEAAFFAWYEKIQAYKDNYNLRMAFDAGYSAALKDMEK